MSSMKFSLNKAAPKAPSLSAKAKAKAEQEEKDRQEEEDRKRVLGEYLDEHGDDQEGADDSGQGRENVYIPQGQGRHHAARARSNKSGPGTLPTPEDNFPPRGFRGPPGPRFGNQYGSGYGAPQGPAGALQGNKKDAEAFKTVIAKASNLPPGMSTRELKALFADFDKLKIIEIEHVQLLRGPTPIGRPTTTMKVHFDKDVTPRALDDAINKMNDKKYIRRGYYLHLDRFLGDRPDAVSKKLPFDAKEIEEDLSKDFAPTAELGGHADERGRGRVQQPGARGRVRKVITAYPPTDPNMLKIVHMTIEGVIKGGIEFEAALMETPRVQSDERWAFLYDASHPVARYYRYRLYQLCSGGDLPRDKELFEGLGEWEGGEPLDDEFATNPRQLDRQNLRKMRPDNDEEDASAPQKTIDPYPGMPESNNGMMTPMSRTFFIRLLSDVPPSTALNEEIAPISLFAIDHVAKGMNEIIQLIVWNILDPFSLSTTSNPKWRPTLNDLGFDTKRQRTLAIATINALKVVSDILMTTSKEGGKCWKYRESIGKEVRDRNVFEYLETLPKVLDMGRIRENEYRKEIENFIELWRDEYVFQEDLLAHFEKVFSRRKKEMEREEEEKKRAEKERLAKEKLAEERKAKEGNVKKETKSERRDDDDDAPDPNRRPASFDGANDTNSDEQPRSASMTRGENTNLQRLPWSMQTTMTVPPELEQNLVDSSLNQNLDSSMLQGTASPLDRGEIGSKTGTTGALREKERPASSDADFIPGETAAARARRLRPKAEDMFASDGE